jgi:membrane protein YdbS with pleckstrin-like domain
MVPIDKGELSVQQESINEVRIQYIFSLKRTLIITAAIGLILYIFSKDWTLGLIAFLWLGVMNWAVAVIRHIIMFNNLIKKITKR